MDDQSQRDQNQQTGIQWLENLLTFQGVSAQVNAELIADDEGASCWLTIDEQSLAPEQVTGLLGEKGQVLDAMQYLANTTLNLGAPQKRSKPIPWSWPVTGRSATPSWRRWPPSLPNKSKLRRQNMK